MTFIMFARKPSSLEDLNLIKSEVTETIELSQKEYDRFTKNMLSDYAWLKGKGGYINGVCQVIKVIAPDRVPLYVNPEGSGYGRYVGIAAS